MEQSSFGSALYNCMTNCALARKEGKCKNFFGSPVCIGCAYYVCNYLDNYDIRHIQLAMLEAESRANRLRSGEHTGLIVLAITALIFLLLLWPFIGAKIRAASRAESASASVPYSSRPAVVEKKSNAKSAYANIEYALQRTAVDLLHQIDVNGDGKVNCIDAAVRFYQYYPDKQGVCIELNYNEATTMNHLFNCVLIDGAWRAVEPQAKYVGRSSYWMREVWRSAYDSSLNEDVTSSYKHYVR